MTQFMTAAEQVANSHRIRHQPTYDELKAINADLLAALESIDQAHPMIPSGIPWVDTMRAAIAKARGETP